jgi:Tol biopolymer transport system component
LLGALAAVVLGGVALGACTGSDPGSRVAPATQPAVTPSDPTSAQEGGQAGGITYGLWDPELDDYRVWVAAEDGSDPRLLVDGASFMSDWSPDGRQIVYEDRGSLQVVDADGTDRHELLSSLGVQWIPEWSPTGEWIAFEGSREPLPDDAGGQFDRRTVWVIAPDGTGLREVLPGVFGVEPVFSPDGRRIAFGHVTKEGSWTTAEQAVEIVNLDGSGRRQVVPPRAGLQHIDWSVDDWLVFNIEGVPPGETGPPDQGTIFAVRPDGTQLHVVRRPGEYNFFKPVWSPDGSQILTGCFDRSTRVDKLCVMDRDGTHLQVVVDKTPLSVNFPAWGSGAS